MTSPKMRMLNAYRGIYSDYYPVSPEFWCFYPAKVLGVSMVEFQREIPHWKGMLETFRKYQADGWCVAGADVENPHMEKVSDFRKISEDKYRDVQTISCGGLKFGRSFVYHTTDPCWAECYPVKNEAELDAYLQVVLSDDSSFHYDNAVFSHKSAGEEILVEFNLGVPFFRLY